MKEPQQIINGYIFMDNACIWILSVCYVGCVCLFEKETESPECTFKHKHNAFGENVDGKKWRKNFSRGINICRSQRAPQLPSEKRSGFYLFQIFGNYSDALLHVQVHATNINLKVPNTEHDSCTLQKVMKTPGCFQMIHNSYVLWTGEHVTNNIHVLVLCLAILFEVLTQCLMKMILSL